jgi:hypothetical protein
MRKEPHTLSCKVTISDFDKAVKMMEQGGYTYISDMVYDKIFEDEYIFPGYIVGIACFAGIALAYLITLI